MTDEKKPLDPGEAFREGVRAVTGILGALRDAVEQTFDELKEKGDLSPERAKEAARDTMRRAQEAVEDVKGRLEFVPRREFEELRLQVAALRQELEAHQSHAVHHSHGHDGGTASQ